MHLQNEKKLHQERKPDPETEKTIYMDLVVFNCQVVPRALQMSYLHEIPSKHGLSNVDIVVTAVEISAAQLEIKPGHNAHELLSNIISSLQRSMVDEILIAPRLILVCSFDIL